MATFGSKKMTTILAAVLTVLILGSFLTIDAAETLPDCVQVVSVKAGDTCFEIARTTSISLDFFNALNPNLDCSRIFLGQWLCISGVPA